MKTNTQTFIELVIEGGYEAYPKVWGKHGMIESEVRGVKIHFPKGSARVSSFLVRINEILLDPRAWQAVGKTRGWGQTNECGCCHSESSWEKQIAFINHLWGGLTPDQALGEILK